MTSVERLHEIEWQEKEWRHGEMRQNVRIESLDCTLSELHEFDKPELRARFNREFVELMAKYRARYP